MRRANKSNKVPNVKLRPPPPSAKRISPHPTHSRDSGFDSEQDATQTFVDVCPRPFKGLVLCATGISDKTTLFKQAIELGAQPLNDLTDKVTHLIALEPGSAKYKCALENRLPIMHPDWITESYNIWLRGDDVDVEESVRTHRLPIFSNVVLCISGIDDVSRRTEINRIVTRAGGVYVKDIKRPVKVTHLLCTSGMDNMTEKMQYATKFNQRKEANIRLVWEQWFWDCLKLQARCDEDLYDVAKPCPERQPTPPPPDHPVPAAHARADETAHGRAPDGADTSSLLEADDEEPAAVKRVPELTQMLWHGLLKPRGFDIQDGKLMRSPSKSQAPPRVPLTEVSPSKGKGRATPAADAGGDDDLAEPAPKPSVLASFRRTQSFAPQTKDTSTQRQPFQRVASAAAFAAPPADGGLAGDNDDMPVASSSRGSPPPVNPNLFLGKTFRAMGEARSAVVRQAIAKGGGRLVSEDSDEDVDYVLVRLVSGSKLYREEPDAHERTKYRTECWLEGCVHFDRICAPHEHISFAPISVQTPVDGSERVVLSVSGLELSEGLWARRLARALGMNVMQNFSRRTTHLLCHTRTGPKYEKAVEWGLPVVDMTWLAGIATSGVMPPETHARPPRRRRRSGGEAQAQPAREAPAPEDHTMADITNTGNDDLYAVREPAQRQSSPLGTDDYADAFGQPSLLLAEPQSDDAAAPPIAGEDDAPLPPAELPARLPSEPLSLAELREDMMTTTIRSSTSPSPLKLPRENSISPAKISDEASKELQERITSLLGKRAAEAEDDVLPVLRQKRARPPKAKPSIEGLGSFSRKGSAASVVLEDAPPAAGTDDDASMLATAELDVDGPVGADGRQRVTYQDPAQNDEKLRLRKLLETQKQQDEWEQLALDAASGAGAPPGEKKPGKKPAPRRTGTRRSARVSGS